MKTCKICGSYAINPHMHGRVGDNLGLCDVCYWRERHNALREAVKMALIDWDCCIMPKQSDARAEVDRLIADETSANCEGEG